MPGPIFGPARIAITELGTDGSGHFGASLVLVTASNEDRRVIVASDPATDTGVVDLAYSPDNSKIAYLWQTFNTGTEEFDYTYRYINIDDALAGTAVPVDVWSFSVSAGFNTRSAGQRPAWSPDGTRIAFLRVNIATNAWDLCAINIDGTGLTVLHSESLTSFWYYGSPPVWSPDGTVIYFSRSIGPTLSDNAKISRIAPNGTGLADITDGATTSDFVLDVFSGGTLIVGRADFFGTGDTWLATMASDGTGWTEVLHDTGGTTYFWDAGSGSPSPDETQLVIARQGQRGVSVINIDGTGLHALNPADPVIQGEGSPDWDGPLTGPAPTPGEGRLVFERQGDDGTYEIWAVDLDGSNLVQLTTDSVAGTVANETPSWSPDGTKIVWWKWGAFDQLWTMNADGTGATMVHDAPADAYNTAEPFISPDGTTILFSSLAFGAGVQRIATIPVAGGAVTLLDDGTGGNAYSARWSPDGTQVVYAVGDEGSQRLCVINADGTGRTLIGAARNKIIPQQWLASGLLVMTNESFGDPHTLATVTVPAGAITPLPIADDAAVLVGSGVNEGRVAWSVDTADVLISLKAITGAGGPLAERFADGTGFPFEIT